MRHLAAMLLAFALVGCAGMNAPRVNAPPSVTESRDEFRKVTQYRGTDVHANTMDTLFIRAWRPDGQPVKYQIYVADYYNGDWRFYTSAYDLDGKNHNVTLISRDVGSCSRYGGCSKTETVGINVQRADLEKYRNSGLSFKLIGRAGEQVFYLPREYITSFLDGVVDAAPTTKP